VKVGANIAVSSTAQDLTACLASVHESVDEIVVADLTGSLEVRYVAEAYSASFADARECQTIPQARNLALHSMQSQWVLALDADERLEPEDSLSLSTHVCEESVGLYSVQVRRYVDALCTRTFDVAANPNPIRTSEVLSSFPAYMPSQQARLFQRSAVVGFRETAAASIEVMLGEGMVRPCRASFHVHKVAIKDQATLQRRRISGYMRRESEPVSAVAAFQLGVLEFEDFQDYTAALEHFTEACKLNPQFGPAWFYKGKCLVRLAEYEAAVEACSQAELSGLHVPMVAETMGEAHMLMGEHEVALSMFVRALRRAKKMQPHCVSLIRRTMEEVEKGLQASKSQNAVAAEPAEALEPSSPLQSLKKFAKRITSKT
jgi:hypothetical protein